MPSAPRSTKRVVIAHDDHGRLFVVGPVFSDTAATTLAEEISGDGWPVSCASAALVSRAELRDQRTTGR